MKRRDFIQQTVSSTAFLSLAGLSLSSFDAKKYTKITILHTNDVHSHIEPFAADHPRNPGMGGAAKRATLIEQIRKEEKNVLLVDAGDIFQGTPFFNYYGGELEFKLMSMMKYAQLPHAKFDFVSANYNFNNTILNDIVKPYKIFKKDGIKIGVFGLGIQLEGLVDKKLYKETQYLDPIETSEEITKKLKFEEKCDLIVCLSHLGYKYKNDPNKVSDVVLAQKSSNIDVIIGGHTHTFLDKPVIEKNKDGIDVIINQVGCYGINLGKIDFYFSNDKKMVADTRNIII